MSTARGRSAREGLAPLHARSACGAVAKHVGHEQGEGEEDHAETEVADDAVPLATCDPRRPEGERDPDHHQDDPAEHRESENSTHAATTIDRVPSAPGPDGTR